MDYTLDQVQFFGDAIARKERERLRDMALAARVAQYDANNWKKFINTLEK